MTREDRSSSTPTRKASRRKFLAASGTVAAGTAIAAMAVPHVHAADDNTIRLAQIGCGNRGNGAAVNALSVPNSGPVKLVAMADVFEDRIARSYKVLSKERPDGIDVPPERQFVGFDAYKRRSTASAPATWPC